MYRVWPGNAIGVRTRHPIPVDIWHQLSATYDGSSKAQGLKLYLGGKLLETNVLRDEVKKSANVQVDHGGEFVVGQRFRARGLAGGLIDDVQVYARERYLTHKYQGRRFRLTDVHGQVLDSIIAYATTIASMLLWRRIFDRVTPREIFNLRLPLVSRTGCTCGDTSWE